MPYIIEPMTQADVEEVSAVERECFATPWPTSAYRRELRNPESNRYIVARVHQPAGDPPSRRHNGSRRRAAAGRWGAVCPGWRPHRPPRPSPYPIAGFAGLWLMVDEAHVTTIGVAPEHRGQAHRRDAVPGPGRHRDGDDGATG